MRPGKSGADQRPEVSGQRSRQRYRGLNPVHRCCAKPCEPLARLAAKIEANAVALDAVARSPGLPSATVQQARRDANTMFGQRSDLAAEFIGCLNDTIPRTVAGVQTCGKPELKPLDLAWVKWCDAFTQRFGQFRALLKSAVGTSAGSWKVQSNYFRITPDGDVDPGSASIRPYPATNLPPGRSTAQFLTLINGLSFPAFPAGATQRRMYMQFTASAFRPSGAGNTTLDTSPVLSGACPGFTNRPPG